MFAMWMNTSINTNQKPNCNALICDTTYLSKKEEKRVVAWKKKKRIVEWMLLKY